MGLRGRVRRLERAAEQDWIVIPRTDGTTEKFPPSAGPDAFLSGMERLRAQHLAQHLGEGIASLPPEHPLTTAALDSSDPKWSAAFFALTPNPKARPDSYSGKDLSE